MEVSYHQSHHLDPAQALEGTLCIYNVEKGDIGGMGWWGGGVVGSRILLCVGWAGLIHNRR